jgi:hypothetical protein
LIVPFEVREQMPREIAEVQATGRYTLITSSTLPWTRIHTDPSTLV